MGKSGISRRKSVKYLGLASTAMLIRPNIPWLENKTKIAKRAIPGTGERIPMVGLGTWQSFDVGTGSLERKGLRDVLVCMNNYGGTVIDSSPMYGRSEKVVGELTKEMDLQDDFFYATKVWTNGKQSGIDQMNASMRLLNRKKMDLIQIHNLVDWQVHVRTLKDWKENGEIRYWGITHYLDAAHDILADVIQREKPDFVQFNYSILNRHAEHRLFDVVQKNKTAVIINRPYQGGDLFRLVKGKSLPKWAGEFGIESWGQYFLKFILSHPLVTCTIPGTSKPRHLEDNMLSAMGPVLTIAERELLLDYLLKM